MKPLQCRRHRAAAGCWAAGGLLIGLSGWALGGDQPPLAPPPGAAFSSLAAEAPAPPASETADPGPVVLPPAGEPVVPRTLPQSTPLPPVGTNLNGQVATPPKRPHTLSGWLRSRWTKRSNESNVADDLP